MDIQLTVVTT